MEAEFLARLWLQMSGWRILASGYSAQGGEIDLVARRGDLVIFVEVKVRRDRDLALLAIDAAKVRRISKAARHWVIHHPAHQGCNYRGDALLMVPWRWPERVSGAFELYL